MAKPAEIAADGRATAAELGAVDILVNNAGIQHVANIVDFPDDKLGRDHRDQSFGRVPRDQGGGAGDAANGAGAGSSISPRRTASSPAASKAAYVAAKHGLVGLTKVVALELANDGVTCNAICPGWVLTPLVQQQVEARAREAGMAVEQARDELLREKQPMLAFTTPEKIGALAVFLCSDAAATMTGAALPIDGGWTAQ